METVLDFIFSDQGTIVFISLMIILLCNAFWACIVDYVASERKQKHGKAFGFFFGPLGLAIIACLPDRSYKEVHVIIEK